MEAQNPVSNPLQEARERERLRVSREEKLRQEIEALKIERDNLERSRQTLIANNWDIDTLLRTKNQPFGQEQVSNPMLEELQKQIAQLRGELSAKEQRELRESRKKEISYFVKENKDKYELIEANELEDEVINLIDSHYKKTNKLLTPDEAAEKIEEYLEKETEKLLNRVKSTKKAQNLLSKNFNISDVKVSKNSGTSVDKIEKAINKAAVEQNSSSKKDDGDDDLREILKSKYAEKKPLPYRGKPSNPKSSARLEELIKKYA